MKRLLKVQGGAVKMAELWPAASEDPDRVGVAALERHSRVHRPNHRLQPIAGGDEIVILLQFSLPVAGVSIGMEKEVSAE